MGPWPGSGLNVPRRVTGLRALVAVGLERPASTHKWNGKPPFQAGMPVAVRRVSRRLRKLCILQWCRAPALTAEPVECYVDIPG
jgi:hypothetical protein